MRPPTQLCSLCESIYSRHAVHPNAHSWRAALNRTSRGLSTIPKRPSQKSRSQNRTIRGTFQPRSVNWALQDDPASFSSSSITSGGPDQEVAAVINSCDKILESSTLPPKGQVELVLESCENVMKRIMDPLSKWTQEDKSATSALLSIGDDSEMKAEAASHKLSPAAFRAAESISNKAYAIMQHPPVYISSTVLEKYISLQSLLGEPETFPTVFELYATKPMPEEGSSPLKYSRQNPNAAKSAIPKTIADRALEAAIATKDLAAAIGIVQTAHATRAFRMTKFIKQGLLPMTALAVAPVAAYTVASQLSHYQSTMDPAMATNIAFAGILAYVGFTSTIGIVAVTTANDQMDRVTWATGMPLRQRWIREDERAAIDKIAGAWGFRQSWKRGEEEGPEWEALREWIGRKGMILDRVSLLEGME